MRRLPPIAAAALAVGLALPAAAAAQCLLANPSFELPGSGAVPAGWNGFGPVVRTATAAHGRYSARITGPNSGSWSVSGVWQALECAPGERWTASVVVLNPSATPLAGGSQALLNIEWRDAGGNLISYESHTAADASTPADAWRVFQVESQAAPAGTATVRLLLGVLQGPTDPTPAVLFDTPSFLSFGPPTHESLQWNDFPSGRTVSFSGRTWRVKGPGYYGPGPNLFDNSTSATWVDAEGRLHLTIRQVGASWYSSEVALVDPLGYGDYVFTTRGRLDLLDPNVVLGLFIWEYGACWDESYLWWNPFNEIDVEFSRWGSPGNPIAQFVAQPAQSGNIFKFNPAFGDTETTSHAMRWLPDRVEFRSWRGGPDDEATSAPIASWTYTGAHIPRPEAPRVHMNMWQLSSPAVAQEAVIEAFTFRSACPSGDCGVLAVEPPAPPARAARLASIAPNPLAAGTTIRFAVPAGGRAELSVYDVGGRRVRRLVAGPLAPGEHSVRWDARDDAGRRVPAGIYLARLSGSGGDDARRMVVIE
jgi:hypothetical protein